MVWFVQPLQRKDADGKPAGLWHLCAQSDEGGGFFAGCNPDHASAEEAQACREAKIAVGQVTGFPYEPQVITINGIQHEIDDATISHERICEFAGQPAHASVVYRGPRNGDAQRSGLTYPGKTVRLENGMVFDCVVTGSA